MTFKLSSNSYISGAPVLISYPIISSSDTLSKYLINARIELPCAATKTVSPSNRC